MKRLNQAYYYPLILTLLVFCYLIIRATLLSITHDEALTFTIASGNPFWKHTANHHWLNTWLIQFFIGIFGAQEWAIRLPNILAFLLFARSAYLLTHHGDTSGFLKAAFFTLFICNPLAVDYFGLARGYGLALAFYTTSLMLVLVHPKNTWWILLCLVLTFYANFGFLLPIGLLLVLFIWKSYGNRLKALFSMRKALPFLVFALIMVPGVKALLDLSASGQLYIGRDEGIMHATLFSWMMMTQPWLNQVDHGLIGFTVFIGLSLIAGLLLFRKERTAFIPATILICYWVLVEILYVVKGVPYPVQRSVLFFVPLFFVLWKGVSEWLWRQKGAWRMGAFVIVLTILPGEMVAFFQEMNMHSTIDFRGDADARDVLEKVDEVRSKDKVSLGMPWYLEPSMEFYRKRDELEWLDSLTRDGIHGANYDYYLLHDHEFANLDSLDLKLIEHYPVSGFDLYAKPN